MGDYIGPSRVNPGSKMGETEEQSLRYLKTFGSLTINKQKRLITKKPIRVKHVGHGSKL